MTEWVGLEPQYDVFADEFRRHAVEGFHNAFAPGRELAPARR
jgi:hypothetical protein